MPNVAENNKNNLVESNESILRKRRRINRIKIGLIVTLLILILIPTVLCVILGFRISRLEKKLDEISSFISMEDNSVDTKNKKNYAFASDAGLDTNSNLDSTYDFTEVTDDGNDVNNTSNNGNTYDVSSNHDIFNNTNPDRGNTSNSKANYDNTSNNIDKDLNYDIDSEYIDYVINPDNLSAGNINIEDGSTEDINKGNINIVDGSTEDGSTEDINNESINKDISAHDARNIYNSSIHNNGSLDKDGSINDNSTTDLADNQQNKDLVYYGKKVYLTFDDGPSSITDEILDILAEYDVKGTFFVVGHTDKKSKGLYRRILDEGHTLGIHSYSHKYSEIYNSVEDFDKDFTKLWKLLYDTTGYSPNLYRFPGGSLNYVNKKGMEEFIRYLNDKGITYYDWNVVNGDASGVDYTEEQMIDNVLNGVKKKNTSIVLMHDSEGKDKTVATLPEILEALISGGAQVLPLDETVPLIQQIKSNSVE